MSNVDSAHLNVDVIIAGGGTSGCVIASRLATADPSLTILVLESGPATRDNVSVVQPGRYFEHLVPTSPTTKFYMSKATPNVGDRLLPVPCGQCLGGGSSINFMKYTRASASDFDAWKNDHKNLGWGCSDLLPLLRKTETFQVKPGMDTHGYEGPLKVSYGGQFTNIGDSFLETCAKYDTRRTSTDDPNGLYECNKYGKWAKWIDAKTGRRSDVPHGFIYDRERPNLQILTGVQVKRVIFENNHAVGVEFLPNQNVQPNNMTSLAVAQARKLVVLSSGAFGSPAILERSGVGQASLLQKLGIAQVADSPGVGENYQDHLGVFCQYYVDDEADSLRGIIQQQPDAIKELTAQWSQDGSGLLAQNAIDAGIKLRPLPDELKEIGSDFSATWDRTFVNTPDKAIMWIGIGAVTMPHPAGMPVRKCCNLLHFLYYPNSHGHLHITSADDINSHPDFDAAFLTDKSDTALLRWGYKRQREYARRLPLFRGEFVEGHPLFSEQSEVRCIAEQSPVAPNSPDLKYTAEDDEVIDDFTRKNFTTVWHSLGTCAMKPFKDGGVVDSRLNVYGVQGLKVADLSIVPSNVGANTYSTALVVAEKAATLIAEELGISL
ncbi:uncharacterized protein FIBRA_05546 [Fibroporia radiculosa]|uniref:Glucose-methanol-choline oxidoreductase N-terminal domain-containing protein n=1 Tax=Fibroporia radiculosa TaxID=599839 RepID=J4GR83_9APHY|nr:uncharacterized protein FIBRA_05546 [Fibroporia radiculosa]CCM03415.1 predicted protein [Fibroporia radiculosa]